MTTECQLNGTQTANAIIIACTLENSMGACKELMWYGEVRSCHIRTHIQISKYSIETEINQYQHLRLLADVLCGGPKIFVEEQRCICTTE